MEKGAAFQGFEIGGAIGHSAVARQSQTAYKHTVISAWECSLSLGMNTYYLYIHIHVYMYIISVCKVLQYVVLLKDG